MELASEFSFTSTCPILFYWQNIKVFNNKINSFNPSYPLIYFESEAISKKLLENKIITTSFKYPTSSGKLNRIVITSNHTTLDLEQLITQIN
jgi:7-keto-8-aminopelargonate synthetase-like enzyme